MRLLSLEINGIRRLVNCKCHLGGKITAVVGPNEAGKTTLLFAAKNITTGDAIEEPHLSRVASPVPDAWVIAADWEIEDADRSALSDFELASRPIRLRIEKRPDGYRTITVTPTVRRLADAFVGATAPLDRFVASSAGKALSRAEPGSEETEDDEERPGDRLDWLLESLRSDAWVDWGPDDVERVTLALDHLKSLGGTAASVAGRAAKAVAGALESARHDDPRDRVWRILLGRVPPCVEFEQEDRALTSSYDMAALDLQELPPALENLTQLAGLDLAALVRHVESGNRGMAATVLRAANDRLSSFYGEAWSQSELHVVLDRDGMRLDILIEEVGGSTYVLSERSDGLRAFVALTAFLARHDVNRPILLIDEAETHLHYDAQRDLVDVLIEQDVAQQVIYTTHSPGCLPPDLGTSIRAVVPDVEQPGVSRVHNEFWSTNAPGFSPLLLMMGAGAAAFTTTRAALLVEGPSDMILLPTLIRTALDVASLPYHVAPGLSTTVPDRYHEFELVAARLVYVVDGDAGGDAIRRRLTAQGLPDSRILSLGGVGSGVTLEDLVTAQAFLWALNAELEVTRQPALSHLPAGLGRYKLAETACETMGAKFPSKVALAGRLLWHEDGPSLSAQGSRVLRRLHHEAAGLLNT